MTRRQILLAAYPRNYARIVELAGHDCSKHWLDEESNDTPGMLLCEAFYWAITSEGDSYWSALYADGEPPIELPIESPMTKLTQVIMDEWTRRI